MVTCEFCNVEATDETASSFTTLITFHTPPETHTICETCRPGLMRIFNSNRLRDGRKLPLAIQDPDLRARCCVHCGTRDPALYVTCTSQLFQHFPNDEHLLCSACHEGVYTQLAIVRQPTLFKKNNTPSAIMHA